MPQPPHRANLQNRMAARIREQRITLLIRGAPVVMFVLYLVAFWNEISGTLGYFWRWILYMIGRPLPVMTPQVQHDLQVTFFTLLVYVLSFFIWLLLTSFQAILPVFSLGEVLRTFLYQLIYISRSHGMAILVRGGQIFAHRDEARHTNPGVVVVDHNSAVVIEHQLGPQRVIFDLLWDFFSRFLKILGFMQTYGGPRIQQAGIAFTSFNEQLRGAIDMRQQSRSVPDVRTYTRDGIEITSDVYTVFSVGQKPDVLRIMYVGERRVENLHVVKTESLPGNRVLITILDDDLEPQDRMDIHQYALNNQTFERYAASDNPTYDLNRIFNAVFAQAHDQATDTTLPWTDLPAKVAVEQFRALIATINFNDLYQLENPAASDFPLPALQGTLRCRVRNTGVLSFRMLYIEKPVADPHEPIYPATNLLLSPIQPLKRARVLRERGVMVITSGFTNPRPVQQSVYQQRLESWANRWESERTELAASLDLESGRIRNQAKAQAVQELNASLLQLFAEKEIRDEALALRVLQSLESLAADPQTRQFLPADTIKLMEQVHNWLKGVQAAPPPPPRPAPPPAPPAGGAIP